MGGFGDEFMKTGQIGSYTGFPVIESQFVPKDTMYVIGTGASTQLVVGIDPPPTPIPWWRTDHFKVILVRLIFALALIAGVVAAAVL